MKYRVLFPSESIEKKFEKILVNIPHRIRNDIMEAVEKLADNPRPFGQKLFKQLSPPIQCYQFTASYRIRIEDYRVLYNVDDAKKVVWILTVRKRNEKTYS